MKDKILLCLFLVTGFSLYGQVGIHTPNPAATLDVTAKKAIGSSSDPDGLLIPRVDRQRAQSMTGVETSTLVYVNDVSTGTQVGTAVNIDTVGYYNYNGTEWIKLNPNVNLYNADGILTEDRTVIQENKRLAFTGATSTNAFSVDESTFSVDAMNHRVGIGTNSPEVKFHVEAPEIRFTNGISKWAFDPEIRSLDQTTQLSIVDRKNSIRRLILQENGNAYLGGIMDSGGNTAVISVVNGNVGVRTTTPQKTLHVNGAFQLTNELNIGGDATTEGNAGTIGQILASNGPGAAPSWQDIKDTPGGINIYSSDGTLAGNRIVNQDANTLAFTGTTTNSFSVDGTTLSVDAANNRVGIGAIDPLEKLTVVDNTNANVYQGIASFFANNLSQGVGIGYSGVQSIGSNPNVNLQLNGKGSGNVALQTNSTGNVGIGTLNPTRKLDIQGSQSINAAIATSVTTDAIDINIGQDVFAYGNRGNNFGIKIRTSSSVQSGDIARINFGDTALVSNGGNRYLSFSVGKTLTELMYMDSVNGGRVGIGTSVPNSNAILDLSATNKGLLPPRLTTIQRNAISNPPAGLMIYNTDLNCMQYWNTASWAGDCSAIIPPGVITSLNCAGATNNGTLVSGIAASGVSSVIPYTGGNEGSYGGQIVTSTGVTGLTATLSAGTFAAGNGTVTYTITGTPNTVGTASFAINIGGQSCTLTRAVVTGAVVSINCSGATNNGTLLNGTVASGVSSVIPYTGGNGGSHGGQIVASTGVTGLTATLAAGSFVNGNGTLTYTITGTPNTVGTASFAINIGGQTCTLTRTVTAAPGAVISLNCAGATNIGTLAQGAAASGVSSSIPYTGGNGGAHNGQTVASTGVTGLTATLPAGNFANGNGSLTYTITGTPSGVGNANFAINIGGQSCTLTRPVVAGSVGSINCGAAINNGILTQGTVASGVSSQIPYTGGNGGSHNGQVVASTGVTGLTAILSPGNFANGNATLTYTITGTPNTSGTATFAISIGGQACTLTRTVNAPPGISLNCAGATNNGNLIQGAEAYQVSSVISYTGGTGASHSGQVVASTGVTGLTATLSPGSFANGSGTLTYTITGTPSAVGTANFAINIGGAVCTLSRTVIAPTTSYNCTVEGVFPDPLDPRKYWRCIRIGGVLYSYIFTCPNGSHFNPVTKLCTAD